MKIIKSKQIVVFLVLIGMTLTFTQCRNTTKGVKKDVKSIEQEAKSEASKMENKSNTSLTNDKMYFDNKMEHEKVLLQLEKAKSHFIIENDKFKADADLKKAEKHLANLENSSDKDYQNFIAKMKADITAAKQSIKNDDKTAKTKLENLSKSFSSEISKLEQKIASEKTTISKDDKRHFAELRAREYLLKAKLASYHKENFTKATAYLDKAAKEYQIAKQYGNEKYNATIENLRKDILKAKQNIQTKEINDILIKLDSFSDPADVEYTYIIIQ